MAGSSPGVSPWDGKRFSGTSENGSINPSDTESVEELELMLSLRTHEEVLENMFSHVNGDMSADAVHELVKVATLLLKQGLDTIQSGLVQYKYDPPRYISTMNKELEGLLQNYSHTYFSANWNLLITHESFTLHVKDRMDMQKQRIIDQKGGLGRNLHMPPGYATFELKDLKQSDTITHQRMELLVKDLLKRTNSANEAQREKIEPLEAELFTLEKTRESSEEGSDVQQLEKKISDLRSTIKDMEKEYHDLHFIGQRMFGQKINMANLEEVFEDTFRDGKYWMPKKTSEKDRIQNLLQIAMCDNFEDVNQEATEKSREIREAEDTLKMMNHGLILLSFYSSGGQMIGAKIRSMASQMRSEASVDANLIINQEVSARGMNITIKPTSSKFISDFGALGFNLKEKFILRNPLTFFNMLEKALNGPTPKDGKQSDITYSTHVSEFIVLLDRMELTQMYHQKMLPITLLTWITKKDSKLREKFHTLLESANIEDIISEDEPLRGALFLKMKRVMKDEFEKRTRERESYSTTSGSSTGTPSKRKGTSTSESTVSSLSNATGMGAQATKSSQSEANHERFRAARSKYDSSVEVKRKKNVMTTDQKGNEVPYTATKEICKWCNKGDNVVCHAAKASSMKEMRCWDILCYRCGLYGHAKTQCKVSEQDIEKVGLKWRSNATAASAEASELKNAGRQAAAESDDEEQEFEDVN